MATFLFFALRVFAKSSTTGVFPVPPTSDISNTNDKDSKHIIVPNSLFVKKFVLHRQSNEINEKASRERYE